MEPRWQKSSYCMNEADCVEVARLSLDAVGVRDTKHGGAGPLIVLPTATFAALLTKIRSGSLDAA